MSTPASPFSDPAIPVLQNAQGITDADRADLHDIFWNSKDPEELVKHLQPTVVPDPVKADLYDLKKKLQPVTALPKITEAIKAMANLDPTSLEMAENHPNVLKAFTSAATAPEKGAEKAAGASKTASEGKPSTSEESPSAAAPAAGQAEETTPDIPPTPAGHALVEASDGGLHHIPTARLEDARKIDPKLTVLHVAP